MLANKPLNWLARVVGRTIIPIAFVAAFQPLPASAQLVQNSICTDDLFCLDQGWTDAERAWWYTVSQGVSSAATGLGTGT